MTDLKSPSAGANATLAIAARSPKLEDVLFQAALRHTEHVRRLSPPFHRDGDIKSITLLLVDASLIQSVDLSHLLAAATLVVFNTSQNKDVLQQLRQLKEEVLTTTTLIGEADLLMPDDVDRFVSLYMPSHSQVRTAIVLRRRPSVDSATSSPVIEGAAALPVGFMRFLAYLDSSIHSNVRHLLAAFVDANPTGDVNRQARESQRAMLLPEAIRTLHLFMVTPEHDSIGHFVLGPAGAGKTTVMHYVAARASDAHEHYYLAIDCTTATARPLMQVPVFTSLLQHRQFAEALLQLPASSQWTIAAVRDRLEQTLRQDGTSALPSIPPGVMSAVLAGCGRSELRAMYMYYKGYGSGPYSATTDSHAQGSESDLDFWTKDLLLDDKRLFAMYLFFLLDVDMRHDFDVFFYAGMWTSAVQQCSCDNALHALLMRVCKTVQGCPQSLQAAIASRDLGRASTVTHDLPLPVIRALVRELLRHMSEERPVTILVDNLDQRANELLEYTLIYRAIGLFKEEITPSVPRARLLLAMRISTFEAHKGIRPSEAWRTTLVRAPDFRAVVQRRCHLWKQAGGLTGDGETAALVSDLEGWIAASRASPPGATNLRDGRRANLLEIIDARHPHNVRDALGSLRECCRSVLLHRQRGLRTGIESRDPWRDRSFEFFVRVFLLRDRREFLEEAARVPNMYDGHHPQSPFNACLRLWLMHKVRQHGPISRERLLFMFVEGGVPAAEIDANINRLMQYDVLRATAGDHDDVEISAWGRFFGDAIVYDLPYIETVWWTTCMLDEFSMGAPHEPRASGLRPLAEKFLGWLRVEEAVAKGALHSQKVIEGINIYGSAADAVQWSLHRIEKQLG